MVMFAVGYLQVLIFVLISVAFLTLLERKVLSYTQLRKGPNKLGVLGLLQPFSDAVKLFSKEDSSPTFSNFFLFWVSPLAGFMVVLFVWVLFPNDLGLCDFEYMVLGFLCCISLSVYGVVFSGWASNSKYALLGSLRAVAQTISYEIVLAFIFICLVFFLKSLMFAVFVNQQAWFKIFLVVVPLSVIFFLSCVIETNRAPFDLAEGESELVSGFNVEYGGLKFALIFMAEYASIFWMCVLCVVCFFGGSVICVVVSLMFFVLMYLFLRSSYPRLRYDVLMYLTWKKFLPLLLLFFVFFVIV